MEQVSANAPNLTVAEQLAARGLKIGDRVVVGSVLVGPIPRRKTDPRRRPAEGTIEAVVEDPPGIRIGFDHPVRGTDHCHAAVSELTRVEST
ncbi:hypothetical protein D2E98_01380 [Mycobacteroides abscessus]|nr:hypothetical protein DDJ47_21545 [Mycobacteroides abscessus]RIT09883.1 hypothetical protein D2E74_04625 [Mycobacteroides abscessus]RIT49478.1 hypothetical protein D2E98_01380 [Mycobacteroides abscessus]